MLIKEHLDILSICTWSSTHYEIAENAVEAGVKAIFREKPITSRLGDADRMVKLCKKKGVILAVDHQRRWDALHQKIKKFIGDGGIGDVQQVTFYYTAGIANTGSHMFDLLRYFFGDVKWVCGVYKTKLDDPSIDGYLFFKNGISAAIQSCDVDNFLIFEMDVLGSKGRLRTANSGNSAKLFKVRDSKSFSGYKELFRIRSPFRPEPKKFMLNAVEDVIKCIERGGEPLCSGEDGKKSLELICAFHESARKDGKKIYLPLKNRNVEIKSR